MKASEPGSRAELESVVVPLVEEGVAVHRRSVETGKVRVRKITRPRVADVIEPLLREDVIVERVPIGRVVTAPPTTRDEGDTLVIPVVEEVLVKQLRLIEEIRIRKLQRVERRTRRVPLRKEEVLVERGGVTGRDAVPEMDHRPG
jgi:stress response protein YsnF